MATLLTCEGLATSTKIKNAIRAIFKWPIILCGVSPDGSIVPMAVNPDGSIAPSTGTGTARTPAITVVTGSGASPVAAGKRSVAFLFSSDWAGTILGVAVDGKTPFAFNAPDGDTLGAIPYTTTAGTLTILTIV